MRGMLWFYWRIMVEVRKIFVDSIRHGKTNIFLIIILFQMNYTEYFTIPIDSDIIVFSMYFLDGRNVSFQQSWR